jgi:hypothetical protein
MKRKLVKMTIIFDSIVNLLLGVALIIFHDIIESLISPSKVFNQWSWILIGLVLLLYGIWQFIIYYLNRINKKVELISSVIAWIFFIILTYALIYLDFDLFPIATAILWILDFYILMGGLFFLWAYSKKG